MPGDRLCLRLVDDAAPKQVTVVRGKCVDLVPVRVEGERKVLPVFDPEVPVEPPFESGRLLLQAIGERRVFPDATREARASHFCVECITLELARRSWEAG